MRQPAPRLIEEMALDAGFDLVGFGPAVPPEAGRFERWLAAGRHGAMDYLARNAHLIVAPDRWHAGSRSAICLGFDYGTDPAGLDGGGRIARYAAGRDYHKALGRRLRRLVEALIAEGVPQSELRAGVDAVPVLERSLAAAAGIGFLAKSSGVIHPTRGPWLLLAELLSTRELPPSGPAPGSCGTCTACLDACPTDAFDGPFELDARRCLSYTTIELRGPIPRALRAAQGDWLFGCDVCIEVCPFTSRSAARRTADPDLAPHEVVETSDLVGVLELSVEQYEQTWTGTAMRRAKREGLRRNAAIVLGNRRETRAVPGLEAALLDADAGVRTAAAWALSRIGLARAGVEAAVAREEDAGVRDDLVQSLDSM